MKNDKDKKSMMTGMDGLEVKGMMEKESMKLLVCCLFEEIYQKNLFLLFLF
jgi:hypothetical protein